MTKTRAWDPAENLKTDKDIAEYLTAALEEGDARLVAAALGDIARAKGMTKVAKDSGLAREALYRALSEDGNPALDTILRVSKALGVRFTVALAHEDKDGPPAATAA